MIGGGGALGVALTGHWLGLDALRRLAAEAETLGYAVVLCDGDASLMPGRPDSHLYDSTALLATLLGATSRARLTSMRLPGFWTPALLARSLTTLQEIGDGRVIGLLGSGDGRHEKQLGMPALTPGERVTRLDEMLDALRALLAGQEVTQHGRYVDLDRVMLTPPATPVPLVVAAAGPRSLAIAQRHADIWDANVPPLPEKLQPLQARLERSIETWIWVFARPGAELDDAARDYRRCAPWFADLSESDVARAVLHGPAERCRERLGEMHEKLGVDLPILDLSGLAESDARTALRALAPAYEGRIP